MNYITKEEVAEMLGISAKEVLRRVHNRQIPFYRLGYRTIRFDPEEIKRWVQTRKVIPIPLPLRKAG